MSKIKHCKKTKNRNPLEGITKTLNYGKIYL